ncbi:hypothetical protein [Streptomyces sp. NPDC054787]
MDHATPTGLLPDTLSDRGNAKLFVRLYAGDYRHVPGLGWYRWDTTRWQACATAVAGPRPLAWFWRLPLPPSAGTSVQGRPSRLGGPRECAPLHGWLEQPAADGRRPPCAPRAPYIPPLRQPPRTTHELRRPASCGTAGFPVPRAVLHAATLDSRRV